MKAIYRLLIVSLVAALLASCSAEKRVWYLQDVKPNTSEQVEQDGQIRIKPLDRLTVVVNSRNPELAVPFNAWSSFNSLSGSSTGGASSSSSLQILTVDENGILPLPIIGDIEAKGKTRNELAREIADKIAAEKYINDPKVNIEFADMKFSVTGEVAAPGTYNITRDRITIFDALAMAGDMTVYGIREEVIVEREVDGIRTFEILDLTSKKVFDSPAFYLQQNDIVYVKPNKYKAQAGTISQNRGFYLSLVSMAITIATFVITLTK